MDPIGTATTQLQRPPRALGTAARSTYPVLAHPSHASVCIKGRAIAMSSMNNSPNSVLSWRSRRDVDGMCSMNRILFVGLLIAGLTTPLSGAERRTHSDDHTAVSIDGAVYPGSAGWSGGEPRGIVQTKGNKKQVGSVTYDPIVVEVGGNLQAPLLGIVKDFCAGSPAPVSLLLHATNQPTVEADKAVLTKVEFPALDGASKESAHIILTFEAPSTRTVASVGESKLIGAKSKSALMSNFRLTVDGLPSARIATVSSLVISRESGRIEISNLRISISSADGEAWMNWRDEFLVKGNNSDGQEKKAALSLLDPAMKNALLNLSLSNVGLVRLTRSDRGAETSSRVEAELYVEAVSVAPPTIK